MMKTKRYDHYLRPFLRGVGSEDRILHQPMATGLESVQGVELQLPTVGTGCLGRKDNNEPLAVTHEVRAPVAA